MRTSKLVLIAAVILVMQQVDHKALGLIIVTRLLFTVYVGLSLLLNWYLWSVVQSTGDQSPAGSAAEPSQSEGGGLNVKEHDLSELFRSRVFTVLNAAVLALLLFKWEMFTPVVLQCCLGIVGLIEDPLFQIYILKRSAEGRLRRPFTASSGFWSAFR
eukprot:ctg_2280.g747